MKKLILIGGTMGVGKTTISKQLKTMLDQSVFLDGDWCWDMHPFVVNDETKEMVLKNITYQLQQFMNCSNIQNIIFCWVMHEQSIIDEILSRLDVSECQVYPISIICSSDALKQHIQTDIDKGLRHQDVLKASLERLPLYDSLNTHKIDTTSLTIEESAIKIINHIR